MKYFPSLFTGVVFVALLQAETVITAARSRQVPLFSKGLRLYGDSRGAGDIEIGPDPTFVCPPNTPVAPHPERCELYYTCYPGYPITLWQCYSDYLFDLKYSGCNYPIEVDCGTRKRPAASAQTTVFMTTTTPLCNTVPSNQPTFTCPTPDGFFAIPNTCTGDYYVCVSGSPYVSTCPNGTVFDPAIRICTPPGNASCTKPVFICPTPDGFFPIPGACNNSYYACVGDVPYVQNCPGTAIFDPITRQCVPATNATCTAATSTVMPAVTSTTTSPTTTRPTTTTTKSITTTPTTTTPITTTVTTTRTITTLPTTTPTTTTPTTTTPSTTTPTTTTSTTTTPRTTTPTTTTPTTTTPSTTASTTTTPRTTTPTTTTPTTTTSTTTKPTTTSTTTHTTLGPFTCPTSHGYFPVPGVPCSTQYYMCSNYYAYLMDCAVPTVYNPAIQTCDWSYNVAGCQTIRMAFRSWKKDV